MTNRKGYRRPKDRARHALNEGLDEVQARIADMGAEAWAHLRDHEPTGVVSLDARRRSKTAVFAESGRYPTRITIRA